MISADSWRWRDPRSGDAPFLERWFEETVARDLARLPDSLRLPLVATQRRAWTQGLTRFERAEDRLFEYQGEAVGRAIVARPEGTLHLVELGFVEAARGRGLGRAAVEALVREAHDRGTTFQVTARRDRAVGFYDRLGLPRADEDELHVRFELSFDRA